MKTTTVARGFIGAVASLLGVVAVGCSAGGWDEGAAGEGVEIGVTEQAIGLSLSLTGSYNVKHPAYIKTASNKVLVVGGYSVVNGNAVTTIKLGTYDPQVINNPNDDTFTFSDILQSNSQALALPNAAGEMEINHLGGNLYLVTGGRDVDPDVGASNVLDEAYVLDITPGSASVVNSLTMQSAHVNHKVVPCTGGDFLVIGGNDGSGATDVLETFDTSSPAFALFRNENGSPAQVRLKTARQHHQAVALASDASKIYVFGGDDAAGTLIPDSGTTSSVTEFIQLDASNCRLNSASATVAALTASTDMAPRTQFAARSLGTPITISSVNYDVIAVGGALAGGAATVVTLYSSANDVWTTTGVPALAAANKAHVRPMFHVDGANGFILAGGLDALPSGVAGVTVSEAETFNGTTFTSVGPMTDDRYAGWVIPNSPNLVGQGVSRAIVGGSAVETAASPVVE